MAKILIVDDISDNRAFLVKIIGQLNHHIVEAVDGSAALEAVHAERPDLVITDVLMPVMDGYELMRQLHLDPATRSIPVVFHTAHYGAREARELALSRGVTTACSDSNSSIVTGDGETATLLTGTSVTWICTFVLRPSDSA